MSGCDGLTVSEQFNFRQWVAQAKEVVEYSLL
jgi:hypothetical protein